MNKGIFIILIGLIAFACTSAKKEKIVTEEDLLHAAGNPGEWLTYGANYSETRFSKLNQVNDQNAKDLGLAWYFDMDAVRGVEATPLVSNGIMYVTGPWSILYALDARTGEKLWEYDPKVPKEYAEKACCDVVNRGAALYQGKVFVASLDGRLVAIDAKTGKKVWETLTVDQSIPYTITGAPRVIKGNVIIGNGGAEYGVRGYISAYDAETGKQVWRFYSVPGNPDLPFESKAMEEASKTWTGNYWEAGGGGTMWDAMAYDPELNLVYVGTGNGSPWSRKHRSPDGGDNLYLSSIVALNPDNGEYVWHYQTTPGDNWDYTATQHLILADLEINGNKRKVIMQAPKNGFFYVIDRTNGEFISGEPFVPINWASHIEYATGRPVENPSAAYNDIPYEAVPGPHGAHNWHPMAFNPQTGLVYIPAQNMSFFMSHDPKYKFNDPSETMVIAAGNWNTGVMMVGGKREYPSFGKLLAWDPVKQKKVWEVEHFAPANGGVLTTAGNLVFQGTSDGRFVAYNAKNGEKLWESPTGTGVIAAPITYELEGIQYISIAVGWGGSAGLTNSFSETQTTGKVYTFKLDGKESMPEFPEKVQNPKLSGVSYQIESQEDVMLGAKFYLNYCYICHGNPGERPGGVIPNLGYSRTEVIQNLEAYVLNRALANKGMPDFTGRLTTEDVDKIKAFIQISVDSN
ncbi:MAG: PQQ-dependent dehydrogenase, methanol/ethanol family [Mongoliibacter sp.]|uniref:PQQ-dependent dehydrogenase, methanol/ethanol family n=1 Tax=Mongoliibacter sp. TaxID=2022438 RepID=UPI0012F3D8AB|nr:PQQ-dependent dehydrogenase, methanol/ethanol family [Mongoliibacter sp.]TVP51967.1 MAG: PQQ-dependent dehydrogenase, methanol/ethanol family [Mongoliibacter sp.]